MSLINQVLNNLERRGAHPAPDQAQVRAVPWLDAYPWKWKVVSAATVLVVLAAVLLWRVNAHHRSAEPAQVKAATAASDAVLPLSAVAASIEEVPVQPAGKLSYELSALSPGRIEVASNVPGSPEPIQQDRPKATTPEADKVASAHVTAPPKHNKPVVVDTGTEPPLKQVSRSQQADAEYRKALLQQQQGHATEAETGFGATLKLSPLHEAARLSLAALLVEGKRNADAERVLQEGLKLKPTHVGFSMALARIQVEHGKLAQALETLNKNLPQADNRPEYQAFYAALLQRENRHKEAVNHYQIAVQLAPRNGIWLMGYAISLQAVNRTEDAKNAYQQALATQTLSPELTAFVQQKLKGL